MFVNGQTQYYKDVKCPQMNSGVTKIQIKTPIAFLETSKN